MTAPTTPDAPPARLTGIMPFFIVRHVMPSIAFYKDKLGFELEFLGPPGDPYFAIVKRDDVAIMLKAIGEDVPPLPNPARHGWARWDAYVHTPDPDALAAEFESRGVTFREPLGVNSDSLRGFEVADVDGYVLYFGRVVKGGN
jgi:catechol 2,3-dioxygenase-like lactoylglutathione lyase family enzyme